MAVYSMIADVSTIDAPAFAFATFPGRAATRPPGSNRSGAPLKRGRI